MGQKVNPIIFKTQITKHWKSKYIEKKSKDLAMYNFIDIELREFLVKFFEDRGLFVNNIKINYYNNVLSVFISYFYRLNTLRRKRKTELNILRFFNRGSKILLFKKLLYKRNVKFIRALKQLFKNQRRINFLKTRLNLNKFTKLIEQRPEVKRKLNNYLNIKAQNQNRPVFKLNFLKALNRRYLRYKNKKRLNQYKIYKKKKKINPANYNLFHKRFQERKMLILKEKTKISLFNKVLKNLQSRSSSTHQKFLMKKNYSSNKVLKNQKSNKVVKKMITSLAKGFPYIPKLKFYIKTNPIFLIKSLYFYITSIIIIKNRKNNKIFEKKFQNKLTVNKLKKLFKLNKTSLILLSKIKFLKKLLTSYFVNILKDKRISAESQKKILYKIRASERCYSLKDFRSFLKFRYKLKKYIKKYKKQSYINKRFRTSKSRLKKLYAKRKFIQKSLKHLHFISLEKAQNRFIARKYTNKSNYHRINVLNKKKHGRRISYLRFLIAKTQPLINNFFYKTSIKRFSTIQRLLNKQLYMKSFKTFTQRVLKRSFFILERKNIKPARYINQVLIVDNLKNKKLIVKSQNKHISKNQSFIKKLQQTIAAFTNYKFNIRVTLKKMKGSEDFGLGFINKKGTCLYRSKPNKRRYKFFSRVKPFSKKEYKRYIYLRKLDKKLWKAKRDMFYNETFTSMFSVMQNKNTAALLSEFISRHIRMKIRRKRHNFFFKYLKKILKKFLNLKHQKNLLYNKKRNIKSIRVVVKGKLNKSKRSLKKILTTGGGVQRTKLKSNTDYAASVSFSSNGVMGVKVWIQYYSNKFIRVNRKKKNKLTRSSSTKNIFTLIGKSLKLKRVKLAKKPKKNKLKHSYKPNKITRRPAQFTQRPNRFTQRPNRFKKRQHKVKKIPVFKQVFSYNKFLYTNLFKKASRR